MGTSLKQARLKDGRISLRGDPPAEWAFPARWISTNSRPQPVMVDDEELYIDDEGKPAKRVKQRPALHPDTQEPVTTPAWVEADESQIVLRYVNVTLVYSVDKIATEELQDGSTRATYHTTLASADPTQETVDG